MAQLTRIAIPYTPRYPEVHTTLESHRFVVLVAHRRFGKTVLAVNHLLKMALLCQLNRGSWAYVAPFRNQAKEIAWSYLKHYSAPVPGRTVNESDLSVILPNGGRIRLFGADNPDALRGLYFDGVVLDEVAQMRPEVWGEILQPALADRMGRALLIGTPKGFNLFSELYERAQKAQAQGDPDWAALLFRVDETLAIPKSEVERLRAELSDSIFRQEMLCDFTAASDDALIPIDLVTEAAGRGYRESDVSGLPVILGVDVARFGSDSSVIMRRQGLQAFEPVVRRGLDTVELANLIAMRIVEHSPARVFVDEGYNPGVIDVLRQRGFTCVEGVAFGGRAIADNVHVNRRMEMWFCLRQWLRDGGAIPDLRELKADLSTPFYSFDAAGRMKLESKDEIRERLGRSPDLADALALTFAAPVTLPGLRREPSRARTTRPAFQQWR